jgi:oxaloacetate decarboxylase alpha subunit
LTPGTPQDYDAAALRHQVPGGMITTLTRQLREVGQGDRLPQVLDEIARVRAELGYPIMVTPLSQVIGAQAVMNVVNGGERYRNVPDEVIRYVLGRFGTPPAPVDPGIRDRIESLPRARALARSRRNR